MKDVPFFFLALLVPAVFAIAVANNSSDVASKVAAMNAPTTHFVIAQQ